jgi:hypothetical protein
MSAAFARALADGEPAADARMSEIGDEIAARLGGEITGKLRERLTGTEGVRDGLGEQHPEAAPAGELGSHPPSAP